jgi:predicted kinase
MATIHMVFGPVGAGKTTYALKLSREIHAVFLCLDDWMATLFAKDAPTPPSLEWALERTARCEAQIWKVCRQLLALDQDVIVEVGFYRRSERDRFRKMAREAAVPVQPHYITADRATRLERVRARNRDKTPTFTIEVDDSTFEWAEGWFELPDEDELRPQAAEGAPGSTRTVAEGYLPGLRKT